ncbi:uncharacterized protein N7483_011365 [Penicillium malachiteum]|uniref:uncharacterized protein n=1 Tax=Penicillium malachiteum TaxID=1324776 RepID=UPI002546D5B8|nr:uncharacterized protein N7483_011365 [Penicillium malachiteum]KAJ5714184.1 hypothetical protein N7483_011365 [Penicillium malachiteum]
MQFKSCLFSLLILPPTVFSMNQDSRSSLESDHDANTATTTLQSPESLSYNADIEFRLSETPVHGVRKMSHDEGEKFFLDYWSFVDDSQGLSDRGLDEDQTSFSNSSKVEEQASSDILIPRSFPFQPSFPWEANRRSLFGPRDFKCPTGTYACESIGRSDRCCSTGDTCQHVKDTGSGDVGCCPNGQRCSNVVGQCPSPWTTCSEALGGGCCIAGYHCVPGGCAFVSVITVTVHSTVILSTKTYSTVPQNPPSSSSTCNTSTANSLAPPARPTGRSTSTHTTTTRVNVCPTGFYACSAVYQGGCCQTGRDCDTTSCPKTRSTTFISNGVTIIEPVTTGGTEITGKCAKGWFSCADTAGGGCCPLDWTCGGSCTAPASKTTIVKEQATAKSEGRKLRVNLAAIMSDKPQQPLPFVYQFAAGAVAGVSEILVMYDSASIPSARYPLDVVKTRVQLQTGAPVAGAEHYNGMVDCFKKIIKTEGFSRLYRGISAPILMEAPKRATKFAANDSWGSFYRNLFGVEKQTQGLATLTGATAGATEAFVVVPFELVKIRLQDKASAGKYNGMLDVVKKIVQTEGPMAMYNGLESTLWRHILWNAGYFGCIFQVRAQLPKPEPGNKGQQTRNDLIAGSIGGVAGTLLNTPMDVVKSRIQNTTKVAGQTPKYNWAWPAVGTVMKEEGFGALYKGFIPKVLRLGPGGGILLVVFTGMMDFFRKMRDE